MTIVLPIYIFIIGLFIGSFLNLLADRLPRNKPVLLSRSCCDFCHKKLSPLELIPVISFIIQKGKCRSCHRKISIKYPIIELLTAIGFLFIYLNTSFFNLPSPPLLSLIFMLVIYSCLIVVSVADVEYLIIPNEIVFIMVIVSFTYTLLYIPQDLLPRITSAAIAALFLFLLFVLTKGKGMGFGDVKLSIFMGLFLGIPGIIIAFYLAFLTGAFVGVILLLKRKVSFGKHIPFGPFLAIATLITFIWQEELLNLSINLLY